MFFLGLYLGGLIMTFVFVHIFAGEKLDFFNIFLLLFKPANLAEGVGVEPTSPCGRLLSKQVPCH